MDKNTIIFTNYSLITVNKNKTEKILYTQIKKIDYLKLPFFSSKTAHFTFYENKNKKLGFNEGFSKINILDIVKQINLKLNFKNDLFAARLTGEFIILMTISRIIENTHIFSKDTYIGILAILGSVLITFNFFKY
ncbi:MULTISPECIES: hypothetical protein [Psychrilyobacter]|uniref:Uncharacterized protein n=2 Tax=Fusobacteriaceae TaxID=203492 RepID=A0ABX9KEB0_9FUSO|nr:MULTISPECIES: hypothetical protein [Psychrilyobacter]RDE59598.1 hypothetical protein DV867_12610 [Psychrilyobacter sp. S5]REI40012.1 hypothetical protein DYH56_12610 [Psychrilyobacter piezotolerans]